MAKDSIRRIGERSVFKGRLVEVVNRDFMITKKGRSRPVTFEVARRPPGVRLIIQRAGRILLTKEYRSELEAWDYRLPGGKVFDSLGEYMPHVDDHDYITERSKEAARIEAREEAGVSIKNPEFFCKAGAGSSIEWDLYYYIISDFDTIESGNRAEFTEIIRPDWFTFREAVSMCAEGLVQEDRSIGVLMRFFLSRSVLRF